MIWGQFLSISKICSSWKIGNRFRYQLKEMLGNFLVKILIHYKTDLKHGVTMPLHQRHFLTCIYSCIKFYCPSVRGS